MSGNTNQEEATKIFWEPIKASSASLRITNPIRDWVDQIQLPKSHEKQHITLSIGDPTVFGNFVNPTNVNDAMIRSIQSRKFNGYAHSAGFEAARRAVARKYSTESSPLTENDIVLASGCSGALQISIGTLCNPGQNLLLPAPGFSVYQTICEHLNIDTKHYKLKENEMWQVDLVHLESLIDANTAAILINNPSNPCGSVYSRNHLLEVLEMAEKHHLPIISDEIYGTMIFGDGQFFPLGSLSKTVPILTVGGIAKEFIVPGWRLGWLILHDRNHLLKEVRIGALKMSQLILGPNTLVQSILEEFLFNTSEHFHRELVLELEKNAKYLCERLENVNGLRVIEPKGAMYMMVGIETEKFSDIDNDETFVKKLLAEENTFVLPGKIFQCPNFFRIVICPPISILSIACDRMESFCKRHYDLNGSKKQSQ